MKWALTALRGVKREEWKGAEGEKGKREGRERGRGRKREGKEKRKGALQDRTAISLPHSQID